MKYEANSYDAKTFSKINALLEDAPVTVFRVSHSSAAWVVALAPNTFGTGPAFSGAEGSFTRLFFYPPNR